MDESSADWEKSCGFKRSGACQIHSWSSFFSFTLDISPMPTLPTLHLLVHTPSSRLQHIAIQWVVNVTMEASGSGKLANTFGSSSMLSPSSWHLDTQYIFTYCSLQEKDVYGSKVSVYACVSTHDLHRQCQYTRNQIQSRGWTSSAGGKLKLKNRSTLIMQLM